MDDNKRLIGEYAINPYTMFIVPKQYGSKIYSKVVELHESFISPFKPIDLVKKSCEYFGSSYDGRREGTKTLINVERKAPIIIDSYTSIYLFPTMSPTKPGCIWISHSHVVAHRRLNSQETLVTFQNGESYTLPVSPSTFSTQMGRTAMLRVRMDQNIKGLEKVYSSRPFEQAIEASEKVVSYKTLIKD
ncbi:MAG TPA: competence protein ComK [Chondromyces sp.]|nr:competence protein ComK [Chondromyces sp.]